MKRTLITGTNGFLANRLIDFIDGDIHGISRYDNHKTGADKNATIHYADILDFESVKRIIGELEVDTIFHLAAQSIVRIANANPKNTFESNIIGTTNILEAVRQLNSKIKVVIMTSDKSYGEHDTLPYMEDFALKAGDPYSTSKSCADLISQCYYKSYGLNVNIGRSANIYGAGDLNLSRIIPNTITKILNGEKPVIYSGVMNYRRELIYVDDVCEALLTIAEKGIAGEAYNIGTNQESHVLKIGELVNKICELMNWGNGISIVEKSFNEIPSQYLCSDKLHQLGWVEKTPMIEGLNKTIEWYKNKFQCL